MLAHRWTSRVSGRGEIFGEFPAACLAEEIETPGAGQIRALFTIAGNPVLSTPRGDRLAEALDTLDLMVSIDVYRNETTRHAHVILPGPSPLMNGHFDIALYAFAVRNVANYSPPTYPLPEGVLDEWQIMLRLAGIAAGAGPDADIAAIDDFVAAELAQRATRQPDLEGRDAQEFLDAVAPRVGPERLLDLSLRSGPYGDLFGAREDGLTLDEARGGAARDRPRPAAAATARGPAHRERQDRAGTGAAAVRRAAAPRRARERRPGRGCC